MRDVNGRSVAKSLSKNILVSSYVQDESSLHDNMQKMTHNLYNFPVNIDRDSKHPIMPHVPTPPPEVPHIKSQSVVTDTEPLHSDQQLQQPNPNNHLDIEEINEVQCGMVQAMGTTSDCEDGIGNTGSSFVMTAERSAFRKQRE